MVVNGLSGNREIEFVQGDTYEYRLSFADESVGGAVQRVVLTSEKFGVQKEFEKDVADGSWVCRFDSSETAASQEVLLMSMFKIYVVLDNGIWVQATRTTPNATTLIEAFNSKNWTIS